MIRSISPLREPYRQSCKRNTVRIHQEAEGRTTKALVSTNISSNSANLHPHHPLLSFSPFLPNPPLDFLRYFLSVSQSPRSHHKNLLPAPIDPSLPSLMALSCFIGTFGYGESIHIQRHAHGHTHKQTQIENTKPLLLVFSKRGFLIDSVFWEKQVLFH